MTGGNTAYTYAWTGPNAFTSAMDDLTGLAPGTYLLTVTDANGCTAIDSLTLTEPQPLGIALKPFLFFPGGNNVSLLWLFLMDRLTLPGQEASLPTYLHGQVPTDTPVLMKTTMVLKQEITMWTMLDQKWLFHQHQSGVD